MNVRAKTTLIILLTLVLGFIIGVLLNRALMQRRIERTLSWRIPGFFSSQIENLLAPDPEQAEKVRKILVKHERTMGEIRQEFQAKMTAAEATLQADLQPLLTPAQKERLSQRPFPPPMPFGGDRRTPGPPWGGRGGFDVLEELKTRLGLSKDQITRIQAIFQERPFPLPPLGFENRDMELVIQRWKRDERQWFEAIAGVLTEDQVLLYERMTKERRQRLRELLAE